MASKKPPAVKQPVYKTLPYATAPPGAVTPDEAGGTQPPRGYNPNSPMDRLAFALSKLKLTPPA